MEITFTIKTELTEIFPYIQNILCKRNPQIKNKLSITFTEKTITLSSNRELDYFFIVDQLKPLIGKISFSNISFTSYSDRLFDDLMEEKYIDIPEPLVEVCYSYDLDENTICHYSVHFDESDSEEMKENKTDLITQMVYFFNRFN